MLARNAAWRFAAATFALAAAVRLAYLFELRDNVLFALRLGDAEAFHLHALRIAGGDWVGAGPFYQAPGYPYFLGLVYTLGGGPLAARVVQALLGATTCVLMGRVAERAFGRAVGRGTGLALALYAPLVFYEAQLLKPALALCLLALVLLLVQRLVAPISAASPASPSTPSSGRRDAFVLGVAFVALALTRENLALLLPLVLYAGWRARRLGVLALGFVLALAPLAARNAAAGERPWATTVNLGPNLYIGNNADADGLYRALVPGRGIHGAEAEDALELARAATGAPLDAAGASRYWRGAALDWMAAEPARAAALTARKVRYALHDEEWADTESYLVYRDASTVLGALGRVLRFGVLLALAAAGVVLTRGRRGRLLLAAAGLALLGVVPFFVFGRLRLPLVPLLLPFAVAAVVEGRARLAAGRGREVALAAGVALVVGALALVPTGPATFPRADTWNSVGNALLRAERTDEARAALARAAPHSDAARFTLGALLAREGDVARAEPLLVAAAADVPAWRSEAHQILATAFLEAGDAERANIHFLRARGSLGAPPESQLNLGIVARRLGEFLQAEAIYRDLITAEPEFAEARNNLGYLYFTHGRFGDARAAYDEALRLAPDYPEALFQQAWILAAAPDAGDRDGARALVLAERWRSVKGAEVPAGLDVLAAARAEAGDFDGALAAATAAAAGARAAGDAEYAGAIERRAAAYRARRGWRLDED